MCSPFAMNIWRPDPRPYRVTTMDLKEVLGRQDIKGTFYQNDNTVDVTGGVTITLSCSMNFTHFPFDTQRCNLELRLAGMTPKLLGVNLEDTDTLGYNVQVCVYISMIFNAIFVKVLPLDNETTPDPSPVAGFTLEMKRKPAKYAFLYFLPSGHNCSFKKKVSVFWN